MEITPIILELRNLVYEYRKSRIGKNFLVDVNAVEIVICLVEYYYERNRPIQKEEEKWFEAGWILHYSMDGTEWQQIFELYKVIVDEFKNHNFYKDVL